MIDSVLKGNGNSRFLKSAVPAGTSWADALAMLQAGTFPIDFNGINTEGFQQVGTPLNKANLLKDATAAQIGLPPSTTPDGMFQALGNTGELHVWRKTVTTAQEIPAGYTLENATNQKLAVKGDGGTAGYSLYIYYCSTISVDDNGTVHPGSETSIEFVSSANMDRLNACKGKFIRMGSGKYSSYTEGEFFIPSDAVFSFTNHVLTVNKCQKVNPYPLTLAGTTTTYPVSTNPNAYQEGDDAKPAGYTLGEVVSGLFRINRVYYSTTIHYANSINVADDGTVTLASKTGYNIAASDDSYTDAKNLAGKFIIADYDHNYCKIPKGVVLFIPANTTISFRQDVPGDEGYGIFFDRYQPVTGYAAIPAGTTIEYLGKLGDKARIQVVSYVGTGTYGSSNPNSLTFDFVPKMVIIRCNGNSNNKFDWIIGMTDVEVHWDGDYHCFVSIAGKTLSFYSFNSSYYQMNESGKQYYAIAIG